MTLKKRVKRLFHRWYQAHPAFRLKWQRLRIMSIPELAYRFQSAVSDRLRKLSDRNRISLYSGPALIKKLMVKHSDDTGLKEQLLGNFRSQCFFPWELLKSQEAREIIVQNFPESFAALMSQANQALSHQFQFFELAAQVFPQAIDWHRDFLGQKSIPRLHWTELNYRHPDLVTDVKYVWELNRHQHLIALGQAYFITGEEKYAQEICDQISDWLASNPAAIGINWCSSLELAIRLISWTWALAFIRTSRSITTELYWQILHSVSAHGHHISRHLSKYSSANNHLIGEAVGLIYAGTYYPELKEAAKWRSHGFQLLNQEIPRQVHPDGVTREQALHYQTFILDFIILAGIAEGGRKLLSDSVRDGVKKMIDFILHIADSHGQAPKIGDADDGHAIILDYAKSKSVRPYFNFGAVWLNENDFKPTGAKIDARTFWLLGKEGLETFRNLPGRSKTIGSKNYPLGGYWILRSRMAGGETIFTFDYGPLGLGQLAAHGHADALSLTLRHNGQTLLIDPGTFRYLGAVHWRDYFRSSAAHNTATVDGLNQSEILTPFQWGKKAGSQLVSFQELENGAEIVARHNGFKKLGAGVIHTRKIVFHQPAIWLIEDHFSGTGEHLIQVYFHLGTTLKTVIREQSSFKCLFPHITLILEVMTLNYQAHVLSGLENPIQGWASEKYGVKMPIYTLKFESKTSLPSICKVKLILKS